MQHKESLEDIEIIHEDNHLLAVNKPAGLLSQADRTGDPDLLTLCKALLKKKYDKPGNVYLGLVHRLDRPVSGLMILAKTSKAASRLSEQIRTRKIQKFYHVVVRGFSPPNGVLIHYLKKDSRMNSVSVVSPDNKSASRAELSFVRESYSDQHSLSLLKINLVTGRPHQIRVQLATEGFPVYGDSKYNIHSNKDEKQLALQASQLVFSHPVSNERLDLTIPLRETWPWTLFPIE